MAFKFKSRVVLEVEEHCIVPRQNTRGKFFDVPRFVKMINNGIYRGPQYVLSQVVLIADPGCDTADLVMSIYVDCVKANEGLARNIPRK